MNLSVKCSALAILHLLAIRTLADEPPRLDVPVVDLEAPLTFIAYGDTRFTQRDEVANAIARRALVARMASETPAAIFIGVTLFTRAAVLRTTKLTRMKPPRGRRPRSRYSRRSVTMSF